MATEIKIEKVGNGYIITSNRVKMVAKSKRDIEEIIGGQFANYVDEATQIGDSLTMLYEMQLRDANGETKEI